MADQEDTNLWFSEEFILPERTKELGAPASGQITHMMPRMKISGYRFWNTEKGPLHQMVLVNLSETSVSPGTLTADQDDKRGAFTDRVEVRVWFENEKRLLVKSAYPDTSVEGGAASTSVSYSLGPGWMGVHPMFNANWSISAGVTQSIPDFEILRNVAGAGGAILEHIYRLRLVGGAVYDHPIDAVNSSGWSGSVNSPPAKARADFTLVSSVLFYTPEPLNSIARLKVSILHRAMLVEKTSMPGAGMIALMPKYDPLRDNERQMSFLSNWSGYLKVDTYPFINKQEWAFDVDLKSEDGGVTQVPQS